MYYFTEVISTGNSEARTQSSGLWQAYRVPGKALYMCYIFLSSYQPNEIDLIVHEEITAGRS